MGFRDYSPGLNRFTTRDMYTGALADMSLGADPFTSNRYAFTGGNPISRIELDGHVNASMDTGVAGWTEVGGGDLTAPGEGKYYKNDTPIDAPKQRSYDDRPFNTSNWLTKLLHHDYNLLLASTMSTGASALRHVYGFERAAENLDHWLSASGEAKQISPKEMLDELPSFKKLVNEHITKGRKSGGDFDSGWRSAEVTKFMALGDKGPEVQDWWYAMDGFQYRVRSGDSNNTITVEVFKRYNWGNVAGGEPKGNVGPGRMINQNELARLHADGYAQDFNVWGSYSYSAGG